MTRPDPGSPDPSANQDDAVWLDLVARLGALPPSPDVATGPVQDAGPDAAAEENSTESPAPGTADAGKIGGAASFRDFDPLGLAPSAPTELSAAERLSAASSGSPESGADSAQGPRDYTADDDDGSFVPEDPPSLAGTDPLTMLAWLGAVGGPVALLLSAMFWRSAPLLAILGIVAAFVLAVVYLIMKLPQEKDENDDGARV